jgi:hypothetical protein
MIMGGRTTPPMPKMPPPVPPPAEIDTPEQQIAELDIEAPKTEGGRGRKYRKKVAGSGKSKSHSKYKGGGLAGYTQSKSGNA